MVAQNNVSVAEWPSQTRFSRAENRDHWYAQQRSQMHGAGIVRQQQTTLTQFVDKLIERGPADAIHTTIPNRCRDLVTNCCVVFCPKQNPLCRQLRADLCHCLSESLGQPSLGRTVFCARTEANLKRLRVEG